MRSSWEKQSLACERYATAGRPVQSPALPALAHGVTRAEGGSSFHATLGKGLNAGGLTCCAGAEGLFGEDETAKAEFEQLAKQERELWGTMLSGVAVKEHMEAVYCSMLRVSCCILQHAVAIACNLPVAGATPMCM